MFKKLILENQQKILNLSLIERNFDIWEILDVLQLNKIIAFLWPRRAWKTFLTFQVVKEFLRKNILQIEQLVYLDFSSLLDKDLDLNLLEEEYFSLFPDKKPFFVFDEIQELNNFPEKLIWLLNKNYKIIITGSNAHLLSKEISTLLRGKVYTKEILPLDFKEYLKFKGITYTSNEIILNKAKYKFEFINFLKWGGFPEIALTDNEIVKENILKTYLDIMIYKDLQDRYCIKNDYALMFFIKRVLQAFWKELNVNKIYNELKSLNVKISKDSLYNFYEYLTNIYLIFPLLNYWAQVKWLKKTYLVDVAFANFVWSEDFGRRFENFVYLTLRKKYKELFFMKKNYEIDFFVPKKNLYIQVVYQLDYENIERETKNLLKQNGRKVLVYFDKEENLVIPDWIELVDFIEFVFWEKI